MRLQEGLLKAMDSGRELAEVRGSCKAMVGPSDELVMLLHEFNWVFPSAPISVALTPPGSPLGNPVPPACFWFL